MMSTHISERPLTGRKVLAMLITFFGVVIGVNVTMAKLAIKTLPGTEVDSAYTASLGYEKEILAARDQSARNWKVDAHIERLAGGAALLQVEARDGDGRPVTGLNSRAASSGRPTNGPILLLRSPRSGSAFTAAGSMRSRRDNGISCWKATTHPGACSCPKIACC